MKRFVILFLFAFVGNGAFAQFTVLHSFAGNSDGAYPNGSLIYDGVFLYGMTNNGGLNNAGVVFKIKPDGTGYLQLLDFSGSTNGGSPTGTLISDGTFLYGMTSAAGINGDGIIFKIKPDGTGYVKLLDFSGTSNGSYPNGSLFYDGTFLYGMTFRGGVNNYGVIFKIKPDGTGFLKLMDFTGSINGGYPFGSLISDGTFLYGMTQGGGAGTCPGGCGTIFKIKKDGTGYFKLLDFLGLQNGGDPCGDLIFDGTFLFGMTRTGGTNDLGSIFKINPNGSGYIKLLDFSSANGSLPYGNLISDGTYLYGMTSRGGVNDLGLLFEIKPDGTGYSDLFDFAASLTGTYPFGSLISDGTILYGMTQNSGISFNGTVFKFHAVGMGIVENKSEIDFNVFPNPSNGNISVSVELKKDEHANFKVMSSLGEIILQQERDLQNGKNKFDLDLNSLAKGIYFIQIKTSTVVVTKRMVLN